MPPYPPVDDKMISEKAKLKAIYDQTTVAEHYIDTRFSKPLGVVQHRIQVQAVNDAIKTFNARSILEIACGPARLTADISGFETGIAIDNSHEMLSRAKRRVPNTHHWNFLRADAFNIPLQKRFHLIYAFRFLRHFTLSDRKRIYTTVRELLIPSGIFIFDIVHYEKPNLVKYFEKKDDIQVYDEIYPTQHRLTTELDEAGFDALEVKEVVRHFYLQAVISRITHVLRLNTLGEHMISILEQINYGRALESIVICRKT